MNAHPASVVRLGPLVLLAILTLVGSPWPRTLWAEPETLRVEVLTLEGVRVQGRLASLGPTEVSLRTPGGVRAFPLTSLLGIQNLDAATVPPAGGNTLRAHLVGGERVLGQFGGVAPDGVVIRTADVGTVTVRFDALRSLASLPPGAAACYEPEARFPPEPKDDVAYVRTGDATTGLLLRAEEGGLVLETARGQERLVAWDDLAVMHLENDPLKEDPSTVLEVETVAGSLLRTTSAPTLAKGFLEFGLRSDPEVRVRVPATHARRVRAYGKAFVFASDLPFEGTFETPYPAAGEDPTRAFLDAWYGARADRRPSGCPLTIHGVTYEHGFAVHARSRVTLETNAAYASFFTLVGVDDVALAQEGGGIVDARVRGDGKVLWEAADLRAGEPPRVVGPLDVGSVKELVLEIDFGRDGLHVRDYVTWADPILVLK